MVDDMIAYLESVRSREPWKPVPAAVRDRLNENVPRAGSSLESVYDAFQKDILPYPTGNIHPRFWGWVMGTGTLTGALADFLAATMNSHVAGYDQSAAVLEKVVCRWLVELMGFPLESSSLLVSGGTAANVNGLTAGVVTKAGFDFRTFGARGGPQLTVYGSSETHSWLAKACESLGLGRIAFREVPSDPSFRIDLKVCEEQIINDIARGFRPTCVVANAGTVNTGAIDNLVAARQLADRFQLWLHVDGAFGSLAAWGKHRHLVEDQKLADSLAFDLHKWGYMPYEVGVVITRDPDAQLRAYGPSAEKAAPSYLHSVRRGISVDTTYFADRGQQLSRGFRALKVWMSMKEQGVDKIAAAIDENIRQAKRLSQLIEATPGLQLLAPVELNVVCFRYVASDSTPENTNALNATILLALQERGIAVPSQTTIQGRFAIRVCITNHRSVDSDFDRLVSAVVDLGLELSNSDGRS